MACKLNVILRWQSLAKALLAGFAGLLTIPAALAAEPSGACAGPEYRAFDFWLGHWQVELADGRFAGEKRVEASAHGCSITEHWRGARGSEGFSVNFYEPGSDRWRQVWVSADSVIEISGALEEGSMVLEGEIRYRQAAEGMDSGLVRPFRGRWTPLPDGRVRQYFEELTSDKKWQLWFEGFYAKAVE